MPFTTLHVWDTRKNLQSREGDTIRDKNQGARAKSRSGQGKQRREGRFAWVEASGKASLGDGLRGRVNM